MEVTAVRIEGPASVAPGATASYRFLASLTDGTTADVTAQSLWSGGNNSVLTVQSPGIVRGNARGEAALFVRNSNLRPAQFQSWHTYVLVLEDGTFRVTGRVQESGAGLPGAQVAVVAGTGTGLGMTTDSVGTYALYGLAGEVRIDATLEGFDRASRTITVTENTSADITMRPTVTPTDLIGSWTMTLTASPGCVPPFPDDARTRKYNAAIDQTGTSVRMDLTAPGLSTYQVHGTVIDRTLTVYLPVDSFYYASYGTRYYSLVEQLAPGRFLAVGGTARGERSGNSVAGTLAGEFAIYGAGTGTSVGRRQVSCQRTDHGFGLTR